MVKFPLACDDECGNEFHFTDTIYEKAIGEGIAKVKHFLWNWILKYVTISQCFVVDN